MTELQLFSKIHELPVELKLEVVDFVDFLLSKNKTREKNTSPKFGCAKGTIEIADDFDEPLDDFKDYMR